MWTSRRARTRGVWREADSARTNPSTRLRIFPAQHIWMVEAVVAGLDFAASTLTPASSHGRLFGTRLQPFLPSCLPPTTRIPVDIRMDVSTFSGTTTRSNERELCAVTPSLSLQDHVSQWLMALPQPLLDQHICASAAFIEQQQQQQLMLRASRNQRYSPILRLPNELLVEIIWIVVSNVYLPRLGDGGRPPVRIHPFRWLWVTHVCRRWRSIALGSRKLWTSIPMTDHPDLLKTFMTRSGHLPVSLFPGSFGSEPQFTIPLLSLLEEAATRIQHMNLRLTKRLLRDLLETRHFGRTEEEGNLPMLESLNLYYPNLFNEANDPPPTIFWFVSDAALPRLHTLKAVGFRWSFHRMLIRSTLTRLSLNPSDEGSLRRWLRLLKNTPLLEELELDTIFGDSDIEDQEIPANARISMPCLRRVVLGEFGSGELVAGLINHLDIPTNCVISLHATDDRQCITAATHSFVLSVVGSKMGTTFSSPAWQPRSMNLHISCTCSTIAFWPHVYHPFSNAARDGYDSDDSDEESAEAPILQCKLHYKSTDVSGLVASLRAGTLPLQALQSLSIDNSGGIDETIWVLLIRCPKLRYLSVTSSTTHRALLALLADPVFLPSLRSLRLKGACWGTKPGLGDSPPEGEAFSVSLERMLVARKDAGRPLVGLVLDSIADLKSEDDRTWLDGPCRRLGTNLVVLVPGRYN